jgi:hypothetical protein
LLLAGDPFPYLRTERSRPQPGRMIRDEPEGKRCLRAGVGRDEPSHRSPQFMFSSRAKISGLKTASDLLCSWCATMGLTLLTRAELAQFTRPHPDRHLPDCR